MSLRIGRSIGDGFRRFLSPNGIALTVALVAIPAGLVLLRGVLTDLVPALGEAPFVGPAFGILTAVLVLMVVYGAMRTFAAGYRWGMPREFFTRRLVFTTLNLILGYVVYAIIVTLGLLFFILPGLVMMVLLFFWPLAIVVEDRNFADSLSRSVEVTSGNFIRTILLMLLLAIYRIVPEVGIYAYGVASEGVPESTVTTVLDVLSGIAGALPESVLGIPVVDSVLGLGFGLAFSAWIMLGLAIYATAFGQVQDDDEADGDGDDDEVDEEESDGGDSDEGDADDDSGNDDSGDDDEGGEAETSEDDDDDGDEEESSDDDHGDGGGDDGSGGDE